MRKIAFLFMFFMLFVYSDLFSYVYGTKVLAPTGNCCVYGYVIYTYKRQVMASPPTFNCGNVYHMKPQVVQQNNCGPINCCLGWTIVENNSFIMYDISGSPGPAFVVFNYTINFAGYRYQTFNFPGYVECWENLTGCGW